MHLQVLVRIFFAVPFIQLRLGIKQVHLARPAMLKEANHRLGFGRVVRCFWREGMKPRQFLTGCRSRCIYPEQMRQGQISQPASGVAEKGAPVHIEWRWLSDTQFRHSYSTNRNALLAKIIWQKS